MPPNTIEFNKNVTDIQDKGSHVDLTFTDGDTITVGVVIGADGIDSFVRAHLWGQKPKETTISTSSVDLHSTGRQTR